ncbi:IS605 OrfB family transposase, partial [Aequitasia blattaphilus]
RNAEKKLAKEQRKLSKCVKGSGNYQKQKRRVALCHEKTKNQRKDYQHKLSLELAREYDVVCVEDLNMKSMSRSLHLGKGVMDNGFGNFCNLLEYKLRDRGKKLLKINRYYPSSKTCSKCGKIKRELSLAERSYRCECGNQLDRDVNAAINIREEGKRMLSA